MRLWRQSALRALDDFTAMFVRGFRSDFYVAHAYAGQGIAAWLAGRGGVAAGGVLFVCDFFSEICAGCAGVSVALNYLRLEPNSEEFNRVYFFYAIEGLARCQLWLIVVIFITGVVIVWSVVIGEVICKGRRICVS